MSPPQMQLLAEPLELILWNGLAHKPDTLCAAPLHLRGLLLISAFQENVVLLAEVLYTNLQAGSQGKTALPSPSFSFCPL